MGPAHAPGGVCRDGKPLAFCAEQGLRERSKFCPQPTWTYSRRSGKFTPNPAY
jgi:hypothetical protein